MTRSPLVIGWLGHGNFGDEAMAYALRGALKQRGQQVPSYYLRGPLPLYRGIGESSLATLHAGERPNVLQKLTDLFRLRSFDAVLVGGGSILHSMTSLAWKLGVIERVRHHDPKAVVSSVGVSIGPLADQEVERLCATYLAQNDLVIVRDEASARTVARLSPKTRVLTSRDLSCVLPEVNTGAWKQATSGPRNARTVAVSFVWRDKGQAIAKDDPTVQRYLAIIDGLLKEGWAVRLFTLYTGPGYRDAELNELLRQQSTQAARVEHHMFDGDIYKTIAALNGCGAVVSMRLHGIVFAYLLNIPFVALEYHRKQADFCETISYPQDLVLRPDADAATVVGAVDSLASRNPLAQTQPRALAAKNVNDALGALAKLVSIPV